jgi:fructose-1,6-bisphosphatase I
VDGRRGDELRRLIWQIAVTGKYISAKIMNPIASSRGSGTCTGGAARPGPERDEILRTSFTTRVSSASMPRGAGGHRRDRTGKREILRHGGSLGRILLVDTNLSIGTIIGIHRETFLTEGVRSMVAALYITTAP